MSGVLVDRFPYALPSLKPIPLVNHWNVRPDQVLVDLGKIIFEVFQLDHDGQADQRRAALGGGQDRPWWLPRSYGSPCPWR